MQRSKKHQTVYEYICNIQTDFGNCIALVEQYDKGHRLCCKRLEIFGVEAK